MGHVFRFRVVPRASTMGVVATLVLFVSMAGRCGLSQGANSASVEARTAAVNRVLSDYYVDQGKREPEAASLAGDKRYDDQLSDFSASAANAQIARGQIYLQRLSEIDTTGLPEKTRAAADSLLNRLIAEQEGDRGKTWQRPLEQFEGLHGQLLSLANKFTFENVKDYDHYVARLRKMPNAFSQIMTNLQLGSQAGRVPPQASVDRVMALTQAISSQIAEASPFAMPLKRFPATVSAAERKRITTDLLDAISTDVIPSYQRVERFVAAHSPKGVPTNSAAPSPAS